MSPTVAFDYIFFVRPIAQTDLTGVHYTTADHLGTPLLQTDSSANVYWRTENEPYGKVWAMRAGDVHQPLRLPGQVAEQFDTGPNGATERSYNNFRWYRPGWGRYTQADPIGLAGGLNAYAYTNNNPIDLVDVLGKLPGCYTAGLWNYRCGPEVDVFWGMMFDTAMNRMLPQYVSYSNSAGPLSSAASIDSCGCFYWGPVGVNLGKAFLETEVGGSFMLGWPDTIGPHRYVPHPPMIIALNVGGGYGLGANRSISISGGSGATEVGLVSPQAGVSVIPMFRVYCPPGYKE